MNREGSEVTSVNDSDGGEANKGLEGENKDEQ